MITGQRCRITCGGKTVEAKVVLGSENRKSLALEFDAALWVSGGMYAGNIALLWREDHYEDLRTGTRVELEWVTT